MSYEYQIVLKAFSAYIQRFHLPLFLVWNSLSASGNYRWGAGGIVEFDWTRRVCLPELGEVGPSEGTALPEASTLPEGRVILVSFAISAILLCMLWSNRVSFDTRDYGVLSQKLWFNYKTEITLMFIFWRFKFQITISPAFIEQSYHAPCKNYTAK